MFSARRNLPLVKHRCREIPSSRQRASQLQRNDSLGRQGDGRRQEVSERQDNEGGEMFHLSAEQKAEGKVIARREGSFPGLLVSDA